LSQEQELHSIIGGCITGDRKAQEFLFRQVYPFAIRIATQYSRDDLDAADILSHAFVKVFRSIASFDAAKGNFHGWLKRIIINEALDHIKTRSRSEARELQEADEPFISNSIIEKIDFDAIMQVIRQLPPATHAVFVLFAIEGYGHREIGQQLGMSEGTSKWHLSEARKYLQKKITITRTS
jgi:RNA polymerase sigma factor (sigma-70 family)